jgi:hypothetical protein
MFELDSPVLDSAVPIDKNRRTGFLDEASRAAT